MQQPDGCFVSLCWPCDGPGIGSVACDSDKDTWKRLDEWIEIQQLSRFFFNYLMLHLKSCNDVHLHDSCFCISRQCK